MWTIIGNKKTFSGWGIGLGAFVSIHSPFIDSSRHTHMLDQTHRSLHFFNLESVAVKIAKRFGKYLYFQLYSWYVKGKCSTHENTFFWLKYSNCIEISVQLYKQTDIVTILYVVQFKMLGCKMYYFHTFIYFKICIFT